MQKHIFVPVADTQKFAETAEKVLGKRDLGELERISREYARRFNWEKVASDDLRTIRTLVHRHTRLKG